MNDRIRNHVEELFAGAPRSRRAQELKDELIANLTDRYNDMTAQGKDEETAYSATIAGIGDIDELIRGLREQEVFDPVQSQMQRQKSALLISTAVAIYIVSLIFPLIFDWMGGAGRTIGLVSMIICWAAATMLLIYNVLSKPKYIKIDDTIVEDFKEWKSAKTKKDAMQKSLISLISMVVTVIFFVLGFFFHAWSPGWMVFLLIPIAIQILKLISAYTGE